ncbi:rRNA maturation RNase YbeY [Candidatus Similichlamydia laticola]|uniref:Endoribonuclease YbeY n=1 Tax=Candidatus Similichlamydia laticola TaxID=2170265 RepID=A0A369KKN5_9BACT|nr:rRNA maturation RNase YbeY [Candidatus Similichlamydia laticola]RDB31566.1 Metal-dependent hydrolase YbeY, involved in rRNA and/or ribosome maturation and assembly [Candidatus Similichlamydia laticola]
MLLVTVENSQRDLVLCFRDLPTLVKRVLREVRVSASSVTLYFADIESICQLHAQFFGDPFPTDCISFPLHDHCSPPFRCSLLGEIFICPRTAVDYAQEKGKDPYEEVLLYLVHGLLHLSGFEDQSSKGRDAMLLKQEKIVSILLEQNLTLKPKVRVETLSESFSLLRI